MNVVKALLIQRGMTAQELADKAGIKKRALDPYMRDASEWGNARGKVLLAVADALDIHPHLLVNGKAEIKITSGGESNFIDEFN